MDILIFIEAICLTVIEKSWFSCMTENWNSTWTGIEGLMHPFKKIFTVKFNSVNILNIKGKLLRMSFLRLFDFWVPFLYLMHHHLSTLPFHLRIIYDLWVLNFGRITRLDKKLIKSWINEFVLQWIFPEFLDSNCRLGWIFREL